MAFTYFASGSNRAADVRGFSRIGHPIGVAAPEVSAAAEVEIIRAGVPVFVDSGAFSEVVFDENGVRVVAPISDSEWRARLALYRRIAEALGARAYLVAPDRIGDQAETLRRLAAYAPELRALRALGARVLVPIQKGAKPQSKFVRDVESVLGFSDFVHAIPSKKRATTIAELREYLRAVRPSSVHFLGLGIKNANAPAVFAALSEFCPSASVSLDSNMIAANVGRGGRVPRLLTRSRDRAARMIANGETSIVSAQELGIVLAWGTSLDIARALLPTKIKEAA